MTTTLSSVQEKLSQVQATFRKVQAIDIKELLNADIKEQLNSFGEFNSVAFESASMKIAQHDIDLQNDLKNWLDFVNGIGKSHVTQIYVGLGWALTQLQIPPADYQHLLDPFHYYKIFDGIGYYDGFFRKRKSIEAMQTLESNDQIAANTYDQGLGRSIWYIYHGDIERVKSVIEKFDTNRKLNLWRGIGIACAYVGGCNEKGLNEIISTVDNYKTQLATGAVMALISRNQANCPSTDTEETCEIWCKQNADELVSKFRPQTANGIEYSNWIDHIQSEL